MDANLLNMIEEEINGILNPYSSTEMIDYVNTVKTKINEYRLNPSEHLQLELMVLLDKII